MLPLRILAAAALALSLQGIGRSAQPLEEVPYVQTPQNVVDAILELAAVGADDRLIDLGSGDGRIVITAARRYGTLGLGIEIDPRLVELATRNAERTGVAGRARFVQQDLFETDFSAATVLTLYLLPDVNLALRPKLLDTLAPGTRIVSHDWDMGEWRPDRSVTVPAPGKPVGREQTSTVHLWIVPARVAGRWTGTIEDRGRARRIELTIEQRFQDLGIGLATRAAPPVFGSGSLVGNRLAFTLTQGGATQRFEGSVRDDRIEGRVLIGERQLRWHANRRAATRP